MGEGERPPVVAQAVQGVAVNAGLLALIDALACAEVVDYLTAQGAAANDLGDERSDHPATDQPAKAA